MKILVLGAGLIGTASAWYLAAAGHTVTVVDRQPGAGLETSFANGGQISVSHAEPWANPHVLPQIVKWLGREDAPLCWRWRADAAQWRWGLAFLRECLPGRTRANIGAIVHLALYSRSTLQALREELALDYDALQRGILHIYTNAKACTEAQAACAVMQSFGLDREPVDARRCVEIEPALAASRIPLVGGDYTPSDESGDAHRFAAQLAAHAEQRGVRFVFNGEVQRITTERGRANGAEVRFSGETTHFQADAVVLALGSYSPLLLAPLGLPLPVVPAKGYSATVPLINPEAAPSVSITDDERKLVYSRLGQRLRIAGTAEFNGYNLEANPVRSAALIARTRQLFPGLDLSGDIQYWCGLRPATPSNVPAIGESRLPGLWLNTGHGTLGWTMACGSGAALADLMSGRRPVPEFPFLRR